MTGREKPRANGGETAPETGLGRWALAGGTVLLPEGRLEDRDVVIEDGVIRALEPPGIAALWANDAGAGHVIDVTGCVVAPGFVDTHVHGGRGANFMTGTPEVARTISQHLAAAGVTSCLAGTASTGPQELSTALARIADLCGPVPGGVEILGIHMEGPFLSQQFRGVHIPEYVRSPTLAELNELWDASGGALRVVTLAPEIPGGTDAIAFLTSRGVVASVGHTGADYAETLAAIASGASRATHLWNGLPPLHHREPGPVLALLESEDVFVELIADGRHVAAEMLRFTIGVAGPRRVVLVSDGTDVAGLPDGPHQRWEGTPVILTNGVSRTLSGGVAGGVVPMAGGVKFLVERCGSPLADALVMSSTTPAASIGVSRKGSLAPGKDADIVVLGTDLSVVRTVARGRTIYIKEHT